MSITKAKLNDVVRKLAQFSPQGRVAAVAALARFKVENTVKLPAENWQDVHDECVAELQKLEASTP